MTDHDEFKEFEPANDAELHALERRWAGGDLRRHVTRIMDFIDQNRSVIQGSVDGAHPPVAVLAVVKGLIAQAGSVHHPSEMRDQAEEIRNEIWIRGEKGDYDRAFITREWTSRHAANWRRWRLKEYLFLVEKLGTEITTRCGSDQRPSAPP
ncbi:MAG: hypothetical protein HY736_15605 [Verrucomicrobia bacterium]|nr:hypothetical protein [Verrucomicrobiota bacterium]